MKPFNINVNFAVNEKDRKSIGTLLRNFNKAAMQSQAFRSPLEIIAQDDRGKAIGGLYGYFVWSWLEINIVAIEEPFRKKGVGKALIQKAEEVAIQKEVFKIRLNTFEFQAPKFYERLGYKVVAIEEGFPEGYSTYHFHKILK